MTTASPAQVVDELRDRCRDELRDPIGAAYRLAALTRPDGFRDFLAGFGADKPRAAALRKCFEGFHQWTDAGRPAARE